MAERACTVQHNSGNEREAMMKRFGTSTQSKRRHERRDRGLESRSIAPPPCQTILPVSGRESMYSVYYVVIDTGIGSIFLKKNTHTHKEQYGTGVS